MFGTNGPRSKKKKNDSDMKKVQSIRLSWKRTDDNKPRFTAAEAFRKSVSNMKTLGRKAKGEQIKENDRLLQYTDICLPPAVPPSIDGTGEKDVSVFATTWNMEGLPGGPTEDQVRFWLPLGYDVYVVALQSCLNVTKLSSRCIQFLQRDGERYEEYMHFSQVGSKKIAAENASIVTFIFVASSLIQESVFQKTGLRKINFGDSQHIDSDGSPDIPSLGKPAAIQYGGAISIELEIFDTKIMVVNVQLTRGEGMLNQRIKDMKILMNEVQSCSADHVILLGDMATNNSVNLQDRPRRQKEWIDGGWDSTRFTNLRNNIDEVRNQIMKNVPDFSEFKEINIHFPPTNYRKPNRIKYPSREALSKMFHHKFNIGTMFSYRTEFPSYPDRIFWNTRDKGLTPCFVAGVTGSCEGVVASQNVPVFSTFRVGSREFGIVTKKIPKTKIKITDQPVEKKSSFDDSDKSVKPTTEEALEFSENFKTLVSALHDVQKALQGLPKQQEKQPSPPEEVEPIGVCDNCFSPINSHEPHFEASGRLYHKQCFKCVLCDNAIETRYYLINGHLYCEADYKDLFNPLCHESSCGERIDGPKVKTNKGYYHPECFKCNLCDKPLAKIDGQNVHCEEFVYRHGELLCVTHGAYMEGRTCFVCRTPVSDEQSYETIVNSGEMLDLHKKCFRCSDCNKAIHEQPELSYLIKDGKILCAKHGGMNCGTCNKGILTSEGFSEIFEIKYHLKCIPSCVHCKKKLEIDDSIAKEEEGLLCGSCAKKKAQIKLRISTKRGEKFVPPIRDRGLSFEFMETPKSVESGPRRQAQRKSVNRKFRKGTRISVFSGYSLPPPPPPPLEEDEQHKGNKADSFTGTADDDAFSNDFETETVNSQLKNIVGEFTRMTSRKPQNSKFHIPGPPPLRPSMLNGSKNGSDGRHRFSGTSTLPPPPIDDVEF